MAGFHRCGHIVTENGGDAAEVVLSVAVAERQQIARLHTQRPGNMAAVLPGEKNRLLYSGIDKKTRHNIPAFPIKYDAEARTAENRERALREIVRCKNSLIITCGAQAGNGAQRRETGLSSEGKPGDYACFK